MGRKLRVSKITSVDLVGEGSCGDAHITLFKNKTGGKVMNYEEFRKSLTPEEIVVLDAEIAKAKGEMPEGFMTPEQKKKLEDEKAAEKAASDVEIAKLKGEIEVLQKAAPVSGQTDEEILKSADVTPAVRAILESNIAKARAAETAIKKMQSDADDACCIAKAKEISFVPEAEAKIVPLLKSVMGVAGAVDGIMDILKSANAIIEKGTAFKEIGTGAHGSTGSDSEEAAWAAIEKAADGLVVKGQVTKAKAIEMVIANQPELYTAYVQALRA